MTITTQNDSHSSSTLKDLQKSVSKDVYLFIGTHDNVGNLNPRTAKLNKDGVFYRFKTRKDAQHFMNNISLKWEEFYHIGKPSSLRQYTLGMSVRDYYNMLDWMEYPWEVYVDKYLDK